MKTINVTAALRVSEVLEDLAEEENLVLKTPEGREFLLRELDDFDAEIEATRRNRELMELLDERSRETETYTAEEVRKKLGLTD
ncbi:MAG TPA: hypothetical protein VF789_29165 [Thermoanaerobaculia bacterium]